jgi:hypothetical protein
MIVSLRHRAIVTARFATDVDAVNGLSRLRDMLARSAAKTAS